MTVGELIAELSNLDLNLPVHLIVGSLNDEEAYLAEEIESVTLVVEEGCDSTIQLFGFQPELDKEKVTTNVQILQR